MDDEGVLVLYRIILSQRMAIIAVKGDSKPRLKMSQLDIAKSRTKSTLGFLAVTRKAIDKTTVLRRERCLSGAISLVLIYHSCPLFTLPGVWSAD